jgi:hypothetical protein
MSVRSVLLRTLPLAAAILFVTVTPVLAADDDVHISVVAILATTKNKTVDPRVACVANEMKTVDPTLTGFSVARMTCKDVAIGAKDCFEVVDGKKVCVTAEKRCEKDPSRVCLKVEAPTLGAITYTTCCGKFFPLVTRYKNSDGDLLIIAVRVKTCKE